VGVLLKPGWPKCTCRGVATGTLRAHSVTNPLCDRNRCLCKPVRTPQIDEAVEVDSACPVHNAPSLPWGDPDSDPIADIRQLHTRLSTPDGQSQLKQLLDLDAAAQRKFEAKERQDKSNKLTLAAGIGAIYKVNRHDGSSTHVGWIGDSDAPVDLAGNPLAVDLNAIYQTMILVGPTSQGSKSGVFAPGICRPRYFENSRPAGSTSVTCVRHQQHDDAVAWCSRAVGIQLRVYDFFRFICSVPGRQHVPDW
jgi:hypothetical protein